MEIASGGTRPRIAASRSEANLGKIDTGVVSVTSLFADEQVYYPLHVRPYTPAQHFTEGKADPKFRTKLQRAGELVDAALQAGVAFRAVVADCFYGEDERFKSCPSLRRGTRLREQGVGYVLALKPSHAWWHPIGEIGSLQEVAAAATWTDAAHPGEWVRVVRHFRDGHTEDWWVLEIKTGPYGPECPQRAVVATTDPGTLPEHTTWYLVTNLPAPGSPRAREEGVLPAADLAEIVRLYGLRNWVEQSYKQTRGSLGWSQYQVRSDLAIRRHWQLVCCAFSFCWYHQSHPAQAFGGAPAVGVAPPPCEQREDPAGSAAPTASPAVGRGKIRTTAHRPRCTWPVALRQVRAWLEPWIMLWRYWRGWSSAPPPPALRRLLDWLWQGHGINLYVSS